MRRRYLLPVAIMLIACPHRSEIARLLEPDGPPVAVGHYPDCLNILNGTHQLMARAEALRPDIESHESILRKIVRDRLESKAPLEFQFKYAGHDSVNNRLVLRYFAKNPAPVEIAGWEVFLVFALPRPRLLKAYVAEVPLE